MDLYRARTATAGLQSINTLHGTATEAGSCLTGDAGLASRLGGALGL
jgi:hypothetical protein